MTNRNIIELGAHLEKSPFARGLRLKPLETSRDGIAFSAHLSTDMAEPGAAGLIAALVEIACSCAAVIQSGGICRTINLKTDQHGISDIQDLLVSGKVVFIDECSITTEARIENKSAVLIASGRAIALVENPGAEPMISRGV